MTRVLITTVPFGEFDRTPIELLSSEPGVEFVINPLGKKLTEDELAGMISNVDIVIAGTESITRRVMEKANRLKLISRVGIGLDSVDLHAARELGITVSYTPDAPAPAVAELTIAHILNLLRHLPLIDRKMHGGMWKRITGRRLALQTVGLLGTGRIGSRVLRHLQGFAPARILVNDIKPNHALYERMGAELVDKQTIYEEADIISVHIPLTPMTRHLIAREQMETMKPGVLLVNTARGGIIHEDDLYAFLASGHVGGAAVDVFELEPYSGALAQLDNCLLSSHMGSMTQDCRVAMEIGATEEALRFIKGMALSNVVPDYEYFNQVPAA